MQNHWVLPVLGYGASALIAVSMMMGSILRLRLINLAGASGFLAYGLLIHAYPVALLNAITLSVNLFHLQRIFRAPRYFQLLELSPGSDYLAYFLDYYGAEIRRILPDFVYEPAARQVTVFILQDGNPVGVFIAAEKPDGVLRVALDFVIPRYRNLQIGRFLFVEQADFFRKRAIREILITPRTKEFGAYLVKVGFESASRRAGSFRIRYANPAD